MPASIPDACDDAMYSRDLSLRGDIDCWVVLLGATPAELKIGDWSV